MLTLTEEALEVFHLSLCPQLLNTHKQFMKSFISNVLFEHKHDSAFFKQYSKRMRLFKSIRNNMLDDYLSYLKIFEPDPFISYFHNSIDSHWQSLSNEFHIDSSLHDLFSYSQIFKDSLHEWNLDDLLLRLQSLVVSLICGVHIDSILDPKHLSRWNFPHFPSGFRSLHLAFDLGNFSSTHFFVSFLIDNGCSVYSLPSDICSPLHYALHSPIYHHARFDCCNFIFDNNKTLHLLKSSFLKAHHSAFIISSSWRRCISCPSFSLCKQRLIHEFNSF